MAERKNKFQDNDCVYIKKPVRALGLGDDYKDFPAGTIGGIIDSYPGAYRVEFSGDPAEDGFIYKYYEITMKEEDLTLHSRG
jgi:hypothetical protein